MLAQPVIAKTKTRDKNEREKTFEVAEAWIIGPKYYTCFYDQV
jgi:hypothetical protein